MLGCGHGPHPQNAPTNSSSIIVRAGLVTVESFLRCGDLASGFTRLQCPDCGHEKLLAFTCKGRHFCPSCHQRRVRSTSEWIATSVCHEVPHRQFVFTIPKVLRGIFRKRRQLLTHLFHSATDTLRDAFRLRLDLPDGKLGAIAAVHTFGDYLIFHPHLHVIPDRIIRPPESSSPNLESPISNPQSEILLVPAPPKQYSREMRPLWRDLILKVWGGDPLECPCCKGTMKLSGDVKRPEQVEFFLRLHGLWEGVIQLARPPPPPFDIETMEPIEPPWKAVKEWIPDDEPDLDWFNRPRNPSNPDPDGYDQSQTWKPEEIQLDEDRILVLESS